jgi:hypothetical protein
MKAKASKRPARGLGTAVWLQGLACGAVVALATPVAVLGGILLAPSIGAVLLERGTSRPTARVTLLCGLTAAASPLVALWQSGLGVGGAIATASDPRVLLSCWAAQGGGWLLTQVVPVLVRFALDAHAATVAGRLKAERARYEEEWGIPPAPEQ